MSLFGTIQWSLSRLTSRERVKFYSLTGLQSLLPIFDFLGLLSLAVITALLTSSTAVYSDQIDRVFSFFFKRSIPNTDLVVILLLSLSILFLLKNLFSLILLRYNLQILSGVAVRISTNLYQKHFSRDILSVQKRSVFENSDALNNAENFATLGILSSSTTLISEFALVIPMSLYLIISSPVPSIIVIAYFIFSAYILHKSSSDTLEGLSRKKTSINRLIDRNVHQNTLLFREFFVRDKVFAQSTSFKDLREESAILSAKSFLINAAPKYAFELIFIVGLTILAIIEILILHDKNSLTVLVTFLFAGSRFMPSLLRIQAALNTIKMSFGASQSVQNMELDLSQVNRNLPQGHIKAFSTNPNESAIEIKDVIFSYSEGSSARIEIPFLSIPRGQKVGLVGKSGAGKSTIADLLLGVLNPLSGTIFLEKVSPKDYIKENHGRIGYVPQLSNMIDSSIAENVAIGEIYVEIDKERLQKSLKMAGLSDFIMQLSDGVLTQVGERGTKLSGGQRQRIALARALYSDPSILILDEATSSLDAESEDLVSKSLGLLNDSTCVIVIAHRLSTIKNLDRILYIENGLIIADAPFHELRKMVPEFDKQASLSGL